MRIFPRTLFGRNVLLMIALIAATEGAAALIYRQYVQYPRIVQLAAMTALYVDAVHASLSSAEPAEREAFRRRLSASDRIRLTPVSEPAPAFTAPRSPAVRLYFSELRQRLGVNEASRADEPHWQAPPQAAVWIRLAGPQEAQWLVISGDRLDAELPWIALGWSLLVAGAALGGAFLIQLRLNQPLDELARAAEQVGRGEAPAPLPETGPVEIAAVARSFNRMSASLARTERERAVMLAGVSHDLRTPLTKLRLAAAMLVDDTNVEMQQSMIRNIEEIDGTIGQFLDFARAGEGEKAVVGDLASLLREAAAASTARGHPVVQELSALPPFAFRPVAMRRAVANLLENAVRHAGGEITLQCASHPGVVRVSMLDRGPGIPVAQAETVKQPFARLPRDTGKPGAGLGLAIVDRIVRLHAGSLELLPRAGGGLEARLSLPVARERQRTTGSPETTDPTEALRHP